MSRREGTSNGMADNIFNSMELDAIGEVMNISLGSSATAVSNLLDHRVEITTPRVSVSEVKDFNISDLEPAIGVEIRYISGLVGSNIMLLKRSDVKVIVDILMGSETPDEEFEMNELTISAVCEVMNQMMGAASTALSDFLGIPVNISTPESFELKNFEEFKKDHFPIQDGKCVVVRFMLKIDNMLQSEFINVMSVDLTRELLSGLGLGEDEDAAPPESTSPEQVASPLENGPKLSQAEIEKLVNNTQPAPQPPSPPASSGGTMSQAEIERLMGSMQSTPQPPSPPASSSGTMSQAEIERLMGTMQSAPQPPSPPRFFQRHNESGGDRKTDGYHAVRTSADPSSPAVFPAALPHTRGAGSICIWRSVSDAAVRAIRSGILSPSRLLSRAAPDGSACTEDDSVIPGRDAEIFQRGAVRRTAGGKPGSADVSAAGSFRGDRSGPQKGTGCAGVYQRVFGHAEQVGRRSGGPVRKRTVHCQGRCGGR